MENVRELIGKEFDGAKLIAHCDPDFPREHLADRLTPGGNYLVLTGPEGDFSPAEIELALSHGFRSVSLGRNRLRTETAALYAVVAVSILNR